MLTSFRLFRLPTLIAVSLLGAGVLLSAGCGKRRPPVPPSRSPVLSSLAAVQQGNKIVLNIARPAGSNPVKQINIYRLNEVASSPFFLSEEDFAARAGVVGTLENPYRNNAKTVLYTDALSSINTSGRLRYSVRYIYEDGRQSAFSSFALLEPSGQVPAAPRDLTVVAGQNAVSLAWQPPASNIDNSTNLNILGYNIYRTTGAEDAVPLLLNQSPIKETSFADANFEFNARYVYLVRAVTLGSAGAPVESSDSNAVSLTPTDVFAPAAPENLSIAAAPGRLSLFFAANRETDVKGYFIYRSIDEKLPLAGWQKLNAAPLASTTFQDERVESGTRYSYYVTAVDNAGNTSAASEIVSETAP